MARRKADLSEMASLVTSLLLAVLVLCDHWAHGGDPNFMDCEGNDRNLFGIYRVCCKSTELPNDCECFDISSITDFRNSGYHKPKCPEDLSVVFTLYTCSGGGECNERIQAGGSNVLSSTLFNPENPTAFIAHGFTDNANGPWVLEMKDELLKSGEYNVISVDWQKGAKAPNYYQATANTRTVGAMVGRLAFDLCNRLGVAPESFHLIGHSLGAHIMGYAGKEFHRLTGAKLGRITGLDPAGPNFESYSENVRLDESDAQFVDVIHTDAESLLESGFGIRIHCGHVDFYPNGGKHQPSCPEETYGILSMLDFEDEMSTGACSHSRALDYFTNSINKCRYNPPTGGDICTMGFHVSTECKGDHYPKTTDTAPFC